MRGEVPTIRPIVPTPRGDAEWFAQSAEYYVACPEPAEWDNDAAQSGTIGSGQETWMQTTVVGPGRIQFRFKMSWVSGDGLAFCVDEGVVASWGQSDTWDPTGWFDIPSGTHTLKWKYVKYSGSTAGSAWIDAIQWTGGVPASGGGADWQQITYTYDPSGRRIAKDVDGVVTKYLYDGDHCIAEYDGSDTLLRKYIHGPSIDEPICMVEALGSYAGSYYYHYDALGSVVALTDAGGDVVLLYEYSIFGEVAASDANHPNRFMFTGREFDKDTGLYYYRARYYNPSIGRFLQTDPIGYADGMNTYAYCRNRPLALADPSGMASDFGFSMWYRPDDPSDPEYWRYAGYATALQFGWRNDDGTSESRLFGSIDLWIDWAHQGGDLGDGRRLFSDGWEQGQSGWALAGRNNASEDWHPLWQKWWFWRLKALMWLNGAMDVIISDIEASGAAVGLCLDAEDRYDPLTKTLTWNPDERYYSWDGPTWNWHFKGSSITSLAHELTHMWHDVCLGTADDKSIQGIAVAEWLAINVENLVRRSLFQSDPTCTQLWPRPGHHMVQPDIPGASSATEAWRKFNWSPIGKTIYW